MDADLAEQHMRSMDSLYVTPVHNNSILALSVDPKSAKPAKWVGSVPSMVVEVFDVISSPLRDPNDPLVLLHQPDYPFGEAEHQQNAWGPSGTYVERTKDGQWYALSGQHFPSLVNSAPMAPWCDKKSPTRYKKKDDLWGSLLGVHPDVTIHPSSTAYTAPGATTKSRLPGIDAGPAPPLVIEPPPDTSSKYRPDSSIDGHNQQPHQPRYDDGYRPRLPPGYRPPGIGGGSTGGSSGSRGRGRGNYVTQPSPIPISHPSQPNDSFVINTWWHLATRIFENVMTVVIVLGVTALMARLGLWPQMREFGATLIAAWNQIANVKQLEGIKINPVDSVVEEVGEQETPKTIVPVQPEVDGDSEFAKKQTDLGDEIEKVTGKVDQVIIDEAVVDRPTTTTTADQTEIAVNGSSESSSNTKVNSSNTEEPKKVSIMEPEKSEARTEKPAGEKKKRKRGSRGGKRNNLAAKKEREAAEDPNSIVAVANGTDKSTNPDDNLQNAEIVSRSGNQVVEDSTSSLIKVSFDKVLGYGSHGTVVFEGEFQNRSVAVKRMVLSFFDLASQEVNILSAADAHPNVIRYYCKHESDQFLYIALELCQGTLEDLIERQSKFDEQVIQQVNVKDVLQQIAAGVNYLHSLKIVHRDLKPQNILVPPPQKVHTKRGVINQQKYGPIRMVISDFGLCKKLEGDQSSFRPTTAQAAGTVGWIAPEVDRRSWSRPADDYSSNNNNCSDLISNGMDKNRRLTRAVDIFSLGCVFYYVLSNGEHPFGPIPKRENNINENLYVLDGLGEPEFPDTMEARDLIESMINPDPQKRPDATQVMEHPYFWSPQERLELLFKVSDWIESDGREDYPDLIEELETRASTEGIVTGELGWHAPFDKMFMENLGAYRKYKPDHVADLLRAIRNKSHHFNELPERLKRDMPMPDGYLRYFTSRFPTLFMTIYYFAKDYLHEHQLIKRFFDR